MKSMKLVQWLACATMVATMAWGQYPYGASDTTYGLRSRIAENPSFQYTPSPADWRDINMYQIFTDRFASSGENIGYVQDKNWYVGSRSYPDNRNFHHGGDWKGLLNNLDYLTGMGVNAVWMSGVQINWQGLDTRFTPYHMYHPTDFFKVDPAMGTFQDLKNVIDAMHARGIYVVLDVVVNHMADLSGLWGNNKEDNKWYHGGGNSTHGWWTDLRHGAPFNDLALFHNHGRIRNWDSYPEYILGAFPGTDDLRTSRQDVRDWLDLAFKNLIDATDCDGFRVDAIKHVEEDWIMQWADDMRKHAASRGKNDFILFGEYFTYDNGTLARYCREPNWSFNSALFFPMSQTFKSVFVDGNGTANLTSALNAKSQYGEGENRLVTFIDNHDVNRIGLQAGGNVGHIEYIMPPALTFLYTGTPVPCLFYGTEHAFQQGGHWNGSNAGPDFDDADHQRETMFNKGFQPGPAQGNKLSQTNAPLYQHIARLNRARADHPSLRRGSFQERWSHGSRGPFAYSRVLGDEEALVALNTSDNVESINPVVGKPDGTEFYNTLNPSETVTVSGGSLSFSLPAKGTKIFVAGNAPVDLWVEGTHNWPPAGEVTSDDILYINTEAGPAGDVVSVTLGYSLDGGTSWTSMAMTVNAEWDSQGGDWYNASLPAQPAGTEIEYYIAVADGDENQVWDNNGGQNYTITVQAGSGSGLWIRGTKNWPLDGAATEAADLWVDAEAGPAGEITSVTIFYGTDGATWNSMAMDLNADWGSNGGNWYNANLGTFLADATVYYYIEATDGIDVAVANNGGLFYRVTIRGTDLAITVPPASTTVPMATDVYTVQGTAAADLAGPYSWTNSLTGASGQIPAATAWTIPDIALGLGANVITVSAGTGGGSDLVAQDNSGNYGGGWTDGSNQGSGFGAWEFNHTQDGVSSFAGVFVGDAADAGISGMGSSAFGFYANPAGSAANAEVMRNFADPMAVGSSFSFQWGINWDSGVADSYRGFSLLAGATELVYINMANSEAIGINGSPMFAAYGAQAMTLNFEYVADGSIRVWGTGRDGAESYDETLTVPAGAPSRIKFYFNASSVPDAPDQANRQMYVDDFSIAAPGGSGAVSAFVTITREEEFEDSNGDGVPDYWYIENEMDPTIPGQGAMIALNGYTYWQSFKLDLDPDDDAVPPFLMDMHSGGGFQFDAPGNGRQYWLQYTPDLQSPFLDIDGVNIGDEIGVNGDPMGFYRVRFLDGGTPPNTNDAVSVSSSIGNSSFTAETGLQLTLSVTGVNIVSSTYSINGGLAVPFTNGDTLELGEGLEPGQSVTLTLHSQTVQGKTDTKTYTYTRSSEEAPAITHVAGTHHWVGEDNRVYINSAGYPEGSTVEAKIIYYVNPPAPEGVAWPFVDMNRNADWINGDWWNMDLGIQPDGTVIQFAVMMMDAYGTEMWDNNNEQNYTVTIGGGVEPGGDKPYSTNPTLGKYRSQGITIDGANTGNEWSDEMLIAIGMANDDPRSLGNNWTMHEAPIDFTHLWACWDDNNLYLAWQLVDVTDIIDPSNAGGAGSGKISNNGGLLLWAVLDTQAGGSTGDMWAKSNTWSGANTPNYQIYMRGDLWAGASYMSTALPGNTWAGDPQLGTTYNTFAGWDIAAANGSTFVGTSMWGVGDADDRNDANAPSRNFLTEGHNTARDSFYEIKIPLSSIGLTRASLESSGIGVMVGGGSLSAMDTLPHDEATLNSHGTSQSNSSWEWEDADVFTAPFARIGN